MPFGSRSKVLDGERQVSRRTRSGAVHAALRETRGERISRTKCFPSYRQIRALRWMQVAEITEITLRKSAANWHPLSIRNRWLVRLVGESFVAGRESESLPLDPRR